MKKGLLVATLAMLCFLLTGCFGPTYEDGYEQGHADGYFEGYWAGRDESEQEYYDRGREDGYAERAQHEVAYRELMFAEALMKLVNQYCEDPIQYVGSVYNEYWGELTKAYGDVCFETVPVEYRELIEYPYIIPSWMFRADTENAYSFHSIPDCYTLLRTPRSLIVKLSLSEAEQMGLEPCSKCVNPDLLENLR